MKSKKTELVKTDNRLVADKGGGGVVCPWSKGTIFQILGFFGHAAWLAGSRFTNQGLNPDHSSESYQGTRWLTTRPPGNSPNFQF